jgi:hypothetical protein
MSLRIPQIARGLVVFGLLAAAGCAAAAINWYSTWRAFALDGKAGPVVTQAQDRSWYWALLALVALTVAVAALAFLALRSAGSRRTFEPGSAESTAISSR